MPVLVIAYSGSSAPAAAGRCPLFEPLAHPRAVARASRWRRHLPVRSVRRGDRAARRGCGASGGRPCGAVQPDDDHPRDGRLRQHVLEATSRRTGSWRQRRRPLRSSIARRPDPDRDRGVQRVREIVQAPTSDQDLLHRALHSLTTGRRTAIGSGILASIDAIDAVDPSVAARASPTAGPARSPRRSPGAYAPDIIVAADRRREQRRAGPARRGPAGGRPRRPRLHDRLRDGQRRLAPASARRQFIGNEPGGGGGGFGGGGWRRWRRRRLPARHRRGHAQGGRRPDGRDVSPGRERRPAARRSSPACRRTSCSGREAAEISVVFVALGGLAAAGGLAAREALAPAALIFSESRERVPRRCPRLRARWDPDPLEGEWLPRTARVAMR